MHATWNVFTPSASDLKLGLGFKGGGGHRITSKEMKRGMKEMSFCCYGRPSGDKNESWYLTTLVSLVFAALYVKISECFFCHYG